MTQQDSSRLLLVAGFAGLTGAALALLFAPRSGRETRADLRKRANDINNEALEQPEAAKHKIQNTQKQAHDLKDRLAEAVKQRATDTQKSFEDTKKPLAAAWDEEI